MKLYIQTKNSQTINHPAMESNLIQAFGSVPETWEPFIRVERPTIGVYELLESETPIYQKVDGVWKDVWAWRSFTVKEKADKQQAVINAFNNRPQAENWSAWALDEETCTMQPPIPRPMPDKEKLNNGIFTFWCGADNNWKDTPVKPEGNYRFNFIEWVWTESMIE